ncbi:MAG TPA: hypothetical protein VGH28_03690 [Polyangiaceae bacterium]|jgi:hypothetical protein
MSVQVRLRPGLSVLDVADASREAVERFLLLAPTKLELALWLRGAYRRATSFVPHSLRSLTSEEQPLPPRDVADLIHHAQCAARQAMAAALSPGAEGLARSLPDVLKLAEVVDGHGLIGYAPVDMPCCLADRVLALIVAEYLTRPEEFIANAEMIFPVRQAGSGVFERSANGGVIRKTPGHR